MGQFQASVVLPRPRAAVFEYLRIPSNLLKMLPEKAMKGVETKLPDRLVLGSRLEVTFHAMGSEIQIIQDVTDLLEAERIVATQQKGPFKLWVHEQRFADSPDGGTLLTNSIQFEPPGGLLGFVVTKKLMMTHMEEWFGQGHEVLRQTLAANCPAA